VKYTDASGWLVRCRRRLFSVMLSSGFEIKVVVFVGVPAVIGKRTVDSACEIHGTGASWRDDLDTCTP